MDKNRPVGVIDSGVGGLSVLRALQKAMPHERFLYLGDTARAPYGTRSRETITAFVAQTFQRPLCWERLMARREGDDKE